MPAYVRLLRDNEAEVRIAAAGKVTKFCRILNPHLAIQHIVPCVKVFAMHILVIFIWPIWCFCHYRSNFKFFFLTFLYNLYGCIFCRNCPQILPSMFAQLWLQLSWEWLRFWERYENCKIARVWIFFDNFLILLCFLTFSV